MNYESIRNDATCNLLHYAKCEGVRIECAYAGSMGISINAIDGEQIYFYSLDKPAMAEFTMAAAAIKAYAAANNCFPATWGNNYYFV